MKNSLAILAVFAFLLSCTTYLKDADEALWEARDNYVLKEDFEGSYKWSFNNNNINKWIVGNKVVANSGTQAAYVSSDSSSYNYDSRYPGITYFYKLIDFPVSSSDFTLSFWWRGTGEEDFDYMTVHLLPSKPDTIPFDTLIGKVGGNYFGKPNWTEESIILPVAEYSGKSYYLTFLWQQDDAYGALPAAIDDIEIKMEK